MQRLRLRFVCIENYFTITLKPFQDCIKKSRLNYAIFETLEGGATIVFLAERIQ